MVVGAAIRNDEISEEKKYKTAAILIIIHGGLMELGGCLALLPILLFGNENIKISNYFSFIIPYFQQNLHLMVIMGVIYGTVRIVGAIGLLKNKMWGLVLSVINCIVTMILMMFMLPVGIMDGILSSTALVLILVQYFDDKKIIED